MQSKARMKSKSPRAARRRRRRQLVGDRSFPPLDRPPLTEPNAITMTISPRNRVPQPNQGPKTCLLGRVERSIRDELEPRASAWETSRVPISRPYLINHKTDLSSWRRTQEHCHRGRDLDQRDPPRASSSTRHVRRAAAAIIIMIMDHTILRHTLVQMLPHTRHTGCTE